MPWKTTTTMEQKIELIATNMKTQQPGFSRYDRYLNTGGG